MIGQRPRTLGVSNAIDQLDRAEDRGRGGSPRGAVRVRSFPRGHFRYRRG